MCGCRMERGNLYVGYHEFNFRSCTGDDLFACSWEVDGKSSVRVILVHGLGEHCGRYRAFAEYLLSRGYSVYAYDYHGFGKSPGRRGDIDSFDSYFRDLNRFVQILSDPWGRAKTVVIGHSLGGLIGLAYGIRYPESIQGLVITSPGLKNYPIPKHLDWLAKVCNVCVPWLPIKNPLAADKLSHDPAVVEAYLHDPLVHFTVTPRFYKEVQKTMKYTIEHAGEMKRPLLLLYAGADQIVDPEGVREFELNLPRNVEKEIVCYPEMYHELLNEIGKEQIWEQIATWIQKLTEK